MKDQTNKVLAGMSSRMRYISLDLAASWVLLRENLRFAFLHTLPVAFVCFAVHIPQTALVVWKGSMVPHVDKDTSGSEGTLVTSSEILASTGARQDSALSQHQTVTNL